MDKSDAKITIKYLYYVPQPIILLLSADSRLVKMLCCKRIDQHELCWFANLFSNFLILRALSVKKYQKLNYIKNFISLSSRLFSKIFTKISIFCFYMLTETEANIYSQK